MCTKTSNRNLREKINIKREEMNSSSFDKSSSSSLSWGEDCEQEATQRVKYEYERMHRVLKGLELIPPNYDEDEYKLWIKTFPSLRSSIKVNLNSRKRSYPTTPISTRNSRKPRRKTMDNPTEILEKDFASLLRISPAPIINKTMEKLLEEQEFTSLPYLTPKINTKINTIEANLKQRKRENSRNLVLPPINVQLNRFRSISAMPCKFSSEFSIGDGFVKWNEKFE